MDISSGILLILGIISVFLTVMVIILFIEKKGRYDRESWAIVEEFFDKNPEYCHECGNCYDVFGNGRSCTVLDEGDHFVDCPGVF